MAGAARLGTVMRSLDDDTYSRFLYWLGSEIDIRFDTREQAEQADTAFIARQWLGGIDTYHRGDQVKETTHG